jgi:retron-type reverse transcriptase
MLRFSKEAQAIRWCTAAQRLQVLWNIDLKDFFPSISKQQVNEAFKSLGYNKNSSEWLSDVCCLDGRLPQGAPTSPALSNLIFKGVDEFILRACNTYNISYSRYADDLSFGSKDPMPKPFMELVTEIIELNGYELNPKKFRLMGPKCRREVTGLTVNEIVSIPRAKRRELRAMFHKVSLDPSSFAKERSHLAGIAGWVHQIHPKLGLNYMDLVEKIPTVNFGEGKSSENSP